MPIEKKLQTYLGTYQPYLLPDILELDSGVTNEFLNK